MYAGRIKSPPLFSPNFFNKILTAVAQPLATKTLQTSYGNLAMLPSLDLSLANKDAIFSGYV
jgi:hypothetical protein